MRNLLELFMSSDNSSKSDAEDLKGFVTSLSGDVFGLKNLPEVVKGALFSKYSRSKLGLRELLAREFLHIQNQDISDSDVVKRAKSFYDRILDGYGDDSIGELGGAHLALENVSMIGAKVIEDCRIGGSPLEKSTRYVPFNVKQNNRYPYFLDPMIERSKWAVDYKNTCDLLFDTYSELLSPLLEHLQKTVQRDDTATDRAHLSTLKARAFDAARGLLPASTFTNVGLFGNGRFFEGLLQKLRLHPLAEMQQLGADAFDQLSNLIPSFIRRAQKDHHHLSARAEFENGVRAQLIAATQKFSSVKSIKEQRAHQSVALIESDPKAPFKVAAALLFPHSDLPLSELEQQLENRSEKELTELFTSICRLRKNRRHKGPRALERASFTFDLLADFGSYRDLQRHRTLSQERQLLTCDYGYEMPDDIRSAGLVKPYENAMERAGETFNNLRSLSGEIAQYCVPMGCKIRWYFHINLRALQWLCELRSAPAGHIVYRRIAQDLCAQVVDKFPSFAPFFNFVDFRDSTCGRLDQEKRQNARSKI